MSLEIILSALAVLGLGAILLACSGPRRFETVVSFCGVALVASGLAMARDGVEGSRRILWALPGSAAVASTPVGHVATGAPALRAAAVGD